MPEQPVVKKVVKERKSNIIQLYKPTYIEEKPATIWVIMLCFVLNMQRVFALESRCQAAIKAVETFILDFNCRYLWYHSLRCIKYWYSLSSYLGFLPRFKVEKNTSIWRKITTTLAIKWCICRHKRRLNTEDGLSADEREKMFNQGWISVTKHRQSETLWLFEIIGQVAISLKLSRLCLKTSKKYSNISVIPLKIARISIIVGSKFNSLLSLWTL